MNKPRDPSTDTSAQTTDTSTPTEQVIQPVEQQPTVDSFTRAPIGEDTASNPIIINR